ncbi:TMV resistance protein N-like [Neltuma alba]|uniref:TMV resistance protein N-like n=1 Tax=Neltuma alba TaxID=207710 RepID=UPI0010A40F7B|nr:TMV resistance protein N-like [Prosopis alba]
MGGIGKTTIAKAIYNEIVQSFEAKSFLTNIRKAREEENGQVLLQEKLLSDILQTKKIALQSLELGKAVIKKRLCHKKALIVLHDINNVAQLNVLCGSREWFGPGGRIIITTRDEHLLKILQVDIVYSMKEMNDNESLKLFSYHTSKQANPIEDFNELSRRVIAYSEGLPLALEILDSYLFDKPIKAWASVLDGLKALLDDQIHKKLKISYDGLSNDEEEEIFLDICCFFIGRDRNYTTQILDGCGLHLEIGVISLICMVYYATWDKRSFVKCHQMSLRIIPDCGFIKMWLKC